MWSGKLGSAADYLLHEAIGIQILHSFVISFGHVSITIEYIIYFDKSGSNDDIYQNFHSSNEKAVTEKN